MTLVELIVATLIIALAALMLVSSYGLAMRLMMRGKDHESAMDQAYQSVDTGVEVEREPAILTFMVNGEFEVEIKGFWITKTVTQGNSQVRMTVFEANREQEGGRR